MVLFPTKGIRCDKDKKWQGVIRCDKKIGAWELILKLLNENVLFPTLGIRSDKVWQGVTRHDKIW